MTDPNWKFSGDNIDSLIFRSCRVFPHQASYRCQPLLIHYTVMLSILCHWQLISVESICSTDVLKRKLCVGILTCSPKGRQLIRTSVVNFLIGRVTSLYNAPTSSHLYFKIHAQYCSPITLPRMRKVGERHQAGALCESCMSSQEKSCIDGAWQQLWLHQSGKARRRKSYPQKEGMW